MAMKESGSAMGNDAAVVVGVVVFAASCDIVDVAVVFVCGSIPMRVSCFVV